MREPTPTFPSGLASHPGVPVVKCSHSPAWNPFRSRLAAAVATVVSSSLSVGELMAASHPKGGDGRGVFVKLELPWTTLAQGERIVYRYFLENASDRSIPVAIPRLEWGLARPIGGQAFLSGKWTWGEMSPIQGSIYDKPYLVERADWPPRHPRGDDMESWTELPAGCRLSWDQSALRSLDFDINATVQLETLQGHWLVGPGRWVSSEPVSVKVLPIPRSEWKQVFDATWSSYGFGKNSCSGTAYTVQIDGKVFLFWKSVRVTEVDSEDRFEHQIDKDGTNMEITIIGPAGTRRMYYHLRHGITRDTPWPIGPVSLFAPKPEPIPPAELAELRRAAAEKPEPEGTNMRDPESSSAASLSGGNMPPDALKEPKRWWPWVAGGLVLVVGLAICMVIRLRRRSHRSSP